MSSATDTSVSCHSPGPTEGRLSVGREGGHSSSVDSPSCLMGKVLVLAGVPVRENQKRAFLTQAPQETWPFPQQVLDMLKGLRGRNLQASIWRASEVGTELVRPQAQSHVGPGSQPLSICYLHQPQNNRRFGKARGQSPRL